MAEYIERDKALAAKFTISVGLNASRRKTAENAVRAYADYLAALPVVEHIPVVNGRWMGESTKVTVYCAVCSNCGELAPKARYCARCGATMGGDGE